MLMGLCISLDSFHSMSYKSNHAINDMESAVDVKISQGSKNQRTQLSGIVETFASGAHWEMLGSGV